MPSEGGPKYYAVNDRPVKLVPRPDGSLEALVFDFATFGFVADSSYFAKVADVGVGKDVDSFTEDAFEALVARLRDELSSERRNAPIAWEATGDGEFPYGAVVRGRRLSIRVNDFPAEPLYTLLVDGTEVEDLEDWPPAWKKPGA